MNTLIVYYSKYGATERLAKQFQQQLSCDCLSTDEIKDISQYQQIILGCSVYAGTLDAKMKTFCSQHQEQLIQKRCLLFLCGLNENQTEKVITENLGETFTQALTYSDTLGGVLDFTQISFMERQILKLINAKAKFIDHIEKNKRYDFLNQAKIAAFLQQIS